MTGVLCPHHDFAIWMGRIDGRSERIYRERCRFQEDRLADWLRAFGRADSLVHFTAFLGFAPERACATCTAFITLTEIKED